jgi:hypothetical protein
MKTVNLLSKAEMKKVLGGLTGTCSVQNDDGGNSHNLSLAEAKAAAAAQGTHWCCDSCATASWFCPTGEYC